MRLDYDTCSLYYRIIQEREDYFNTQKRKDFWFLPFSYSIPW